MSYTSFLLGVEIMENVKELLRGGYIARLRSNEEYIYVEDAAKKGHFIRRDGYISVDDYDDELLLREREDDMREFDVMEILAIRGYEYAKYLSGTDVPKQSIWKRTEDDHILIGIAEVEFVNPILSDGKRKSYLFEINYDERYAFPEKYKNGTNVLVDTVHGVQVAKIIRTAFYTSKKDLNRFLAAYHPKVKLPLKKVIGRVVPV